MSLTISLSKYCKFNLKYFKQQMKSDYCARQEAILTHWDPWLLNKNSSDAVLWDFSTS